MTTPALHVNVLSRRPLVELLLRLVNVDDMVCAQAPSGSTAVSKERPRLVSS
jgi:hypothetical protein